MGYNIMMLKWGCFVLMYNNNKCIYNNMKLDLFFLSKIHPIFVFINQKDVILCC